MNKLIFGKDDTQNITNISFKNGQAHLFMEVDGEVKTESFEYAPWVMSSKKLTAYSERLKGDQFYKYLTPITVRKYNEVSQNFNRELWFPRQIEECLMLCEGHTYFKGMKVQDVSILSFDIETSGLVMDETSQVYLITNTFRKNGKITKRTFCVDDYQDQIEMIGMWTEWVMEVNPSILCGHNILSYDLPYLNLCSGSHGLQIGRDGSKAHFAEKTSRVRKDGSQQYDFHNVKVFGREIVDTFFLSLKYDIGREFPSYGLKPIIKHLGLEKADRTFIDASQIRKYYNDRLTNPEMWDKVKAYAEDDSDDALKLYDIMIPSYFYLAQSIPKTMQQMINEASGSQLDGLMIRSYLQDGYSQPKTSPKAPFEGAISMGQPGIYSNVLKADIASLYPSVMLEYNIHDKKKDPNNYMIQMLTYFRDERLRNKKLAKETGEKYFDDLQNSQKIMINSMYGFLGSGFLLYNYPEGGAEVTKHGREILLKGVEWATGYTLKRVVKDIANEGSEDEEITYEYVIGDRVCDGRGFTLVNVDTDSFSITNGSQFTNDMFRDLLAELNSLYSALIRWENDGIYQRVVVVRAKNYVLLKDGKLKFKGSAITDQKKEPALTEMLESLLVALIEDESASLPVIYRKYIREALNIQFIQRWATKKTVTKSVLKPNRLTEQKILDAINDSVTKGVIEGVQEGDKVWLYNMIDGEIQVRAKGEAVFYKDGRPKMKPNEILRDVRLWNKDEDKMHYVDRVYSTVNILSSVVNMDNFMDFGKKCNSEALKELTNKEIYAKV